MRIFVEHPEITSLLALAIRLLTVVAELTRERLRSPKVVVLLLDPKEGMGTKQAKYKIAKKFAALEKRMKTMQAELAEPKANMVNREAQRDTETARRDKDNF